MANNQDDLNLDMYMNEMRARKDCKNYKAVNAHEEEIINSIITGRKAAEKLRALNANESIDSKAEAFRLRALVRAGKKARDAIVTANMRLVPAIAKKYQNQGLPLIDLIQYGNMGLLHAIDLYETGHGTKFTTYATPWIQQYIDRALKNTARSVRMPVHVETELRKINKATVELKDTLQRMPTFYELSEKTGIPSARVKELVDLDDNTRAASLDMNVSNDDKATTLGEIVLNTDDGSLSVFETTVKQETAEGVLSFINQLSTREKTVLMASYGLNGDKKTLDELGKQLGLTRERVRQIRVAAEDKLRKLISNKFTETEIIEMMG